MRLSRLCARPRGSQGAGRSHSRQRLCARPKPTSIDAGIYGFIANIFFYDIDTPLKQFVVSQPNLVRHCTAIHQDGDAEET